MRRKLVSAVRKNLVLRAGLGQWQTAALVMRMTGVRFTEPAPRTCRNRSVVDRLFCKQRVAGSIPASGSSARSYG